jgi:hypothetical protein
MDRCEAFTKNYKENLFKGELSKSGPGSDPQNTIVIREELTKILHDLKVNILLDAPCGDFYWMKDVLKDIPIHSYYGVDIVPELIDLNNRCYQTQNIRFICYDLVESELFPKYADLLFCRDCLVHLSFNSAKKILNNFVNSDIKYLLTTTFTRDNRKNMDFVDGTNWYPINLFKEPFNFPKPKILINEECTEKDQYSDYSDKCLALWTREEIQNVMGT